MKVKPFGKLPALLFLTLWFSGIVFAQDQQWDALILQLDSEDPAKSSAAAEALIASQAHGSMDALIAILKDPQKDFEKRITVANILGQRRETSAVPELIRLFEEDLKNRTGSWSYLIPTLA